MTADIIITRGRVCGNPNHLGQFKIVKNRRGEEGIVDYSIRLGNGRFKSLPKGVYDQLKQEKEKKNYTEADIDGMVRMYNAQLQQINKQLAGVGMPGTSGGGSRGTSGYGGSVQNTPFGGSQGGVSFP